MLDIPMYSANFLSIAHDLLQTYVEISQEMFKGGREGGREREGEREGGRRYCVTLEQFWQLLIDTCIPPTHTYRVYISINWSYY